MSKFKTNVFLKQNNKTKTNSLQRTFNKLAVNFTLVSEFQQTQRIKIYLNKQVYYRTYLSTYLFTRFMARNGNEYHHQCLVNSSDMSMSLLIFLVPIICKLYNISWVLLQAKEGVRNDFFLCVGMAMAEAHHNLQIFFYCFKVIGACPDLLGTHRFPHLCIIV